MGNCLVRIKQDWKRYRSSRHREQPLSLGRRSDLFGESIAMVTRCPDTAEMPQKPLKALERCLKVIPWVSFRRKCLNRHMLQ